MLVRCLSGSRSVCKLLLVRQCPVKHFSVTPSIFKLLPSVNDKQKIDHAKVGTGSSGVENWTAIYKFNRIQTLGFFARIKIYTTAMTFCMVPICYAMVANDQMSQTAFNWTCNVASFSMCLLYVITYFTQRVIGVISISEDRSVIRIGYLTFWGFRRNTVIPVEDIVQLSDIMDDNPKDLYVTIRRCSDPRFQLHLSKRYFTIVNVELFEKVFGVSELN